MDWKVLKGKTRDTAELDSTWPTRAKANDRAKTLRKSYRGKKVEVFVEEATAEDPKKWRKPIAGPFTNYDAPRSPKRVK